jgi:hypothetical protein
VDKWIYSSLIPSPHLSGSSLRQAYDGIGLTLLPDVWKTDPCNDDIDLKQHLV